MRLVFLGSGAFAVPCLEALLEAGHDVAAVLTQPDREKGRGRALAFPPVKTAGLALGLPVLQPRRVREPEALQALRRLEPEVQVLVAYGQILPRSVIDVAPRGTVNVHGSLLPAYRGAAPVQWAVVHGEPVTGVTTMLVDEGLDTGPILLSRETPVGERETAGELEARLARLGAALLLDTLCGLLDGSCHPRPQDASRATLAPLLKKEDGRIDWGRDAACLDRRVRGFHPWPGAFTSCGGRSLKVLQVLPLPPAGWGAPGEVLSVGREGLAVACGDGTTLRLEVVQPESRKPMPAAAFAAGARLEPGARLG